MTDTSNYSLSDIAAVTNGNDGFGGNNGAWWIIILFLVLGWGGRGYGYGAGNGNGGGGTYLGENYALISDNASLERKIDGVNNGLCDGFYSTAQLINGVNMQSANNTAAIQNTLTQGFAGLNTAIVSGGYETRNAITQDTIANMQGFNGIQGAVKDCCCTTQQNIKDTQYAIATNAAGVQNQIQNTGFDISRQIERGFADTNYAMAQQNCATLQAIDKVGDRIIDRLTQDKLDTLRDENASLRLSASQSAQNQYLINQLRPAPYPAYVVPNPYCNCNNGCGCA